MNAIKAAEKTKPNDTQYFYYIEERNCEIQGLTVEKSSCEIQDLTVEESY